MDTVELHGAFVWDCDHCGAENFVRAVSGDLDEAAMDADENRIDAHMVAPDMVRDDGTTADESAILISRILLAPVSVTCRECDRAFRAEIPHRDD